MNAATLAADTTASTSASTSAPTSADDTVAADHHFSIHHLEGCLGRVRTPTEEEIGAAVADLETLDTRADADFNRTLPPLLPGQRCSVVQLEGCLGHLASCSAPTLEELDAVIADAASERYLRSFA